MAWLRSHAHSDVELFAYIPQVDQERRRFSVTLKPALTASPDASLLASLYADTELAARLR